MKKDKSKPEQSLSGEGSHERALLWFLGALLVINGIQAAITDLTGDEALYWMYSRHLDWGFKDHPPVIGLFTAAGSTLFSGALGVRFFVILANALTLLLLYRLARPASFWPFALLVATLPVLHIYGFIAAPDVPLLLAAAAYLLAWRKFLEEDSMKNTLLLGVWMAALVWSKYHGILIILFTWLPHRKLWFHPKFWLAGASGVLLFVPHILWQIAHDLPTVKFHIVERSGEWRWSNLTEFVLGQFGVFNPLVVLCSVILLIRTRASDRFEQSLRGLMVLTFLFFLFMSARGRVEAHWTAACVFPITILLVKYFPDWLTSKWFMRTSVILLILISAARLALMVDFVPAIYRAFHRSKEKLKLVHSIAGDRPVCFMNSYQDPSLYMFYFPGKAHSIQNSEGGKNQYDWWNYNEFIHQKPFLFVASYDAPGFQKASSSEFDLHSRSYSDLPVLHGLDIRPEPWRYEVNSGDSLIMNFEVINKNSYPLNLSDTIHPIRWNFLMGYKKMWQQTRIPEWLVFPNKLAPGEHASGRLRLIMDVPEGSYRCGISARIDSLPQTYQSQWIRIEVH